MSCVDFILNLAGLLLWIKWRSLPFDPIHKRTPATLVGTLRRAAPSRFQRWHLLAAIGLLVGLRALLYQQVGPAVHWTGQLDLGVLTLSFRSELFGRMLCYSLLSFALGLVFFYLCLLLLSLLAGRGAKDEPVHRLVRMQLGRVDGWPRWMKVFLPFATGALCWWPAGWLLARLAVIPAPISIAHHLEQSAVIGLGSYLAWKFAAATLLVVHLLNNYIYFGKHPFWSYVNTCARTLLWPLQKIPLRAGRMDFTPVAGIALIFFAGELAERALVWLYARLPL